MFWLGGGAARAGGVVSRSLRDTEGCRRRARAPAPHPRAPLGCAERGAKNILS